MRRVQEQQEIVKDSGKCADLIEREGRIERATRNAYYEVGIELRAIRDNELYKATREHAVAGRYTFTTFEEYCQERWEMGKSHASRLIESAEVVEHLKTSPIGEVLPSRESHVRELLALESDEDRAAVWRRVTESGVNITAQAIAGEVQRYRAEKDRNWITLEEWTSLDESRRAVTLSPKPDHSEQFNYQDSGNIEWARWSWNPVTGCRFGCEFCYARDIANRFFPTKFDPTFYPSRLSAPKCTKPKQPALDWTEVDMLGHRNVFVCSMADLFGEWVPREWIEAVIAQCANNQQWTFLFLTKNPKRLAEFEFPGNSWVGATVHKQSSVAHTEKAMAAVRAGVKWVSVEPMLEPIRFNNINVFDWVVIGGASKSSQTPEFFPPFRWIYDLYHQCSESEVRVYFKVNLLGERVREYPNK